MTLLARYVIKTALLSMSAGVFGLLLLQTAFAYLSELDSLSDNYRAAHAMIYIVYSMPSFWADFAPTGVLLGAVIGLGLLAKHNEIVSMQAATVSLYRIIGWAMIPACVFVMASLAINEWVLPYTSEQAQRIKYAQTQSSANLSSYWTMTSNAHQRQIVAIDHADSLGNIQGVKRFDLINTADGVQLVSALSASAGVAKQAYVWQLHDVNHLKLQNRAQTLLENEAELSLPISKESVHLLTKPAENLAISELDAHRQLMAHQGRRSKPHELAFWQKTLSPFALLSLLIVACSFVFGSLRAHSMGFRIVLALLIGLLFRYLQDLSGFIALVSNIPLVIMGILPIILSGGVGLWLLNKKQ